MAAPGNELSREMVKAVQANNQKEVVRLCKVGEEFTGTYGMGDTLMHWAVSKNSTCDCDLLEFLWTGGAPTGQPNASGATPLRIAIRNGHRKLAICLIGMGESLPVPVYLED
eukprot:GFUD01007701.1.p1 GENE.GFUD01007701.1~~GFUD01007701.1.p1  ORF type:complete len:112 (+),score=41.55 GFUD01007701.1:152-487(+)